MGRRNTGNRLHHDRKAELMQTFQTLCKKYLNIQFLPQREHRPFLIGYLLNKIIAGCYKTDKKHKKYKLQNESPERLKTSSI